MERELKYAVGTKFETIMGPVTIVSVDANEREPYFGNDNTWYTDDDIDSYLEMGKSIQKFPIAYSDLTPECQLRLDVALRDCGHKCKDLEELRQGKNVSYINIARV